MDLHIHGPEATPEERSAVDAVLGPPTSGWAGGQRDWDQDGRISLVGGHSQQRDLLLPALHAVQDRFGWIPPGAFNYVCRRLSVPPAEAYGVATFYHLFSLTPKPAAVVHVCDDIACRIQGGEALCRELEGSTIAWKRSPCLGQCERAPAALVIEAGHSPRAFSIARAMVSKLQEAIHSGKIENEDYASLRDSVPQFGNANLR